MDKTFEEAARRIAGRIFGPCGYPRQHIEQTIRALRAAWPNEPTTGASWHGLFDDVVEYANLDQNEIAELVIRKQHDYGHDNILAFGLPGIVVRISDKWARIQNLEHRGVEPTNESLEDSWRDIAGYALIAMMLEEGVFTLPLERDVCGKTGS